MRPPDLGPRGEGWVLAQFLVGGLVIFLSARRLPKVARRGPSPGIPLGAGLMVAGTWMVARGAADLGPSLTPFPRPLDHAELVERGVFASIRHPIYAGVIGVCFGWSILSRSPAAFVASIGETLLFVAKASLEEEWLLRRYRGYVAYRSRTDRFLPGIY